jgi:hypothetical protein
MANGRSLAGHVIVRHDVASFEVATARVRLEHIPRADAAATIVAESIVRDVSHCAGIETEIPFFIRVPDTAPRSHLNLRAHIDVDGDGQVSEGDLVTARSYPVTDSSGYRLEVERVGN